MFDVDEQRFDQVTRLIGGGASRRRVLKLLGAGVLGGAFATMTGRAARAGVVDTCSGDSDCDAGLVCVTDDGSLCEVTEVGEPVCTCQVPAGGCESDETMLCSTDIGSAGKKSRTVVPWPSSLRRSA